LPGNHLDLASLTSPIGFLKEKKEEEENKIEDRLLLGTIHRPDGADGQKSFMPSCVSKGAFPPSHFSNKLADKLAHKVPSQTNVTHLCPVCQSEVCYKPHWLATNSLRQLCKRVCHQVCCKNVMVETHLKRRTSMLGHEGESPPCTHL
jgi:hypothetical protein